jgi:hypothetical protein
MSSSGSPVVRAYRRADFFHRRFGNPAILRPMAAGPVALRPHLTVGLPLSIADPADDMRTSEPARLPLTSTISTEYQLATLRLDATTPYGKEGMNVSPSLT